MQLPETFDARTVQPKQGGSAHPPGMFDFQITNTYLKETPSDQQIKTGVMLVIELTSPVGVIENRYNITNPSKDAERISQEQLSALCHAVNIFQVAFPKNPDGSPIMDKAGYTLRGGRGRMEIAPQMVKGADGKMVENGYMKVNKIFDANGNEPGKQGAAPMTQQSGGGWGNSQPQAQPQQQPAPQQQQPAQQSQQWGNPPAQQNGGWSGGGQANAPQQQQPQGGGTPPWAK